jgi:hypothetical protein
MCVRNDTLLCNIYNKVPKILAFDIHECVQEHRRMEENEVRTI